MVRNNKPGWLHRLILRLVSFRIGTWLVRRPLYHLDRLVLRLTRDRRTMGGIILHLPVSQLTTTGAKSGQPRQVPVLVVEDGDDVVLIASNWGGAHRPAWYYNLMSHPAATLSGQNGTRAYTAREAADAERGRYWALAEAIYPGYADYRRRAKRKIPIMVLTPAGQTRGTRHTKG